MPRPAVGHIVFRRDDTSIRAYVTLVTSTFLLKAITSVSFMLRSSVLVCYLPRRKPLTLF